MTSYIVPTTDSVEAEVASEVAAQLAGLDLSGLDASQVQALIDTAIATVTPTSLGVLTSTQTNTAISTAVAAALASVTASKVARVGVNRVGQGGNTASIGSSGGVGNATSRIAFAAAAGGIYDIDVTYHNWYILDSGTREVVNGNAVTLKAAIEYNGVTVPLYWPNGSRTITVDPGASVTPLRASIELPGAAPFWIRTLCSYTGTYITVPYNSDTNVTALGAAYNGGWTTGDVVDTAGTMTNATNNSGLWGPHNVSAYLSTAQPVVGVIGDSLSLGTGDSGVGGYIRRGLGTIPHILYGRGSTAALDVAPIQYHSRRFRDLTNCTHVIEEMGVNDIGAGQTLAATQASRLALWTLAAQRGCKVFATTTTPVDGQVSGKAAIRVQLNNWLRDGAPILGGSAVATGSNAGGTLRAGQAGHPLVGYFEVADLAETSRDSGAWKVGYSDDGTHPNATGSAALAPGIDTARLTV